MNYTTTVRGAWGRVPISTLRFEVAELPVGGYVLEAAPTQRRIAVGSRADMERLWAHLQPKLDLQRHDLERPLGTCRACAAPLLPTPSGRAYCAACSPAIYTQEVPMLELMRPYRARAGGPIHAVTVVVAASGDEEVNDLLYCGEHTATVLANRPHHLVAEALSCKPCITAAVKREEDRLRTQALFDEATGATTDSTPKRTGKPTASELAEQERSRLVIAQRARINQEDAMAIKNKKAITGARKRGQPESSPQVPDREAANGRAKAEANGEELASKWLRAR